MDDEDVFRNAILDYAFDREEVDYHVEAEEIDDGILVQLATGDFFEVTVKQVWP